MSDVVVTGLFTLAGAIVGGSATYLGAVCMSQRSALENAGRRVREAFSEEHIVINEAIRKGTGIGDQAMLEAAYKKHATAISEFRFLLPERRRAELDKAWEAYCQEPGKHRFHHYITVYGDDPEDAPKKLARAVENINHVLSLTKP